MCIESTRIRRACRFAKVKREVFSASSKQPVSVQQGMSLPFAGVLVPEHAREQSDDALSEWSRGRGEAITADNTITSQLDEDLSAGTRGSAGVTYYPFLGLSSVGQESAWPRIPLIFLGSLGSIYLPGYSYRPPLLGIVGLGPIGRRFPPYPLLLPRVGGTLGTGYGTPLPRLPMARPGVIHVPPAIACVHPAAHR